MDGDGAFHAASTTREALLDLNMFQVILISDDMSWRRNIVIVVVTS